MAWKPNKLVAAILGFFLQSLGMLYVIRVKWAFIYFGIGIVIGVAEFILLNKYHALWPEHFSFNFILMPIGAIHAYRVAKSSHPYTKRPWYSRWFGLTAIPLSLVFGIIIFRSFLYEPFRMPSRSMAPTITPASILIAEKIGYGHYGTFGISLLRMRPFTKTRRGDVIVFQYPRDPSVNYVKRVVGLPGDVVEYKNKILSVNGIMATAEKISDFNEYEVFREKLDSVNYHIYNMHGRESHDFSLTVPTDQYFVLGDNRDNSNDSRYWGFIPAGSIVGKVVYTLQ
jgi:signal peptidase I